MPYMWGQRRAHVMQGGCEKALLRHLRERRVVDAAHGPVRSLCAGAPALGGLEVALRQAQAQGDAYIGQASLAIPIPAGCMSIQGPCFCNPRDQALQQHDAHWQCTMHRRPDLCYGAAARFACKGGGSRWRMRAAHDGLPHTQAVPHILPQRRIEGGSLRRPLVCAMHRAARLPTSSAPPFKLTRILLK